VAILVTCAAAIVAAQVMTGKPGIDTSMTDLVIEVSALRQAVERSTVVTARSQLLLGRVQVHENRLAWLARQVEDTRERLTVAESEQASFEQQVRQANAAAQAARSPEERQALAGRIPELRAALGQAQTRTNRLRAEHASASTAFNEEQSRSADFNGRLEALERTLASLERALPVPAAERERP